ncbi:MAG: formate dehydrogenase, partial [Gammaproteobacteria bacterium]|nr:formate dehydrogenase [Gammaproteobacteria bacterium]
YICGEETSLLESLEGKRGLIRAKPPLPAVEGLFGKPTLVHNVITFCSVPWIVRHGGAAYREYGVGDSSGTMPFQLSGNVKQGGLIEIPFGMPLGEFIDAFSGGTRSGRPIKAVQIGGPLGAYLSPAQFDTPLTYEAMAEIGAGIGHGGIVVFDETVDLAEQAQYSFQFCEIESCGKCTPCRIGSVRGKELVSDIRANGCTEEKLSLLKDLCDVMEKASLCQMGGMTPIPVESALKHFPQDFGLEP